MALGDLVKKGSKGAVVKRIQKALDAAGFSPGAVDGDFGSGTQAAVKNFQASEGLLVDGIVGPRTKVALGLAKAPKKKSSASLKRRYSASKVAPLFPKTAEKNIRKHLPNVVAAMHAEGLDDDHMMLMALATIRAETTNFEPIEEYKSKFNTSPNGHPFDRYDKRKDLGNRGEPDGDRYKGRGFIQLTGRANYQTIGKRIGMSSKLEKKPELGSDSKVAAKILASFLAQKERAIKEALLDDDLKAARRLVNGGSHGLKEFSATYRKGAKQFLI